MRQPRFKARRGAVVVMLGVMLFSMIAISALAIDFSRLWSVRNELETSADAAAHAGAIQLFPPRVKRLADSVARAFAQKNLVMNGVDSVELIEIGKWDDATSSFAAGHTDSNAIRVVVSRRTTGLIMNGLGVPPPRLRASAIGWAEAPVVTTGCIKPWAVPMVHLMYRINLHRGITPPGSWANLTRPFQQDSDVAALNRMTVTERTFSLKLGSTNGNGNNQVNDSVGTMPGNYQAVRLGKLWDAATQTYPTPGPETGGNDYESHIEGPNCFGLSIGDSLATEPGNKVGPTVDGAQMDNSTPPKGVCTIVRGYNGVDNTPNTDPTYGDCVDANGNVGIDIKAAFYMCASGCNGTTVVSVNMLGAFTLLKVYPGNSKNNTTPVFEKAEIVGVFKPVQDLGPVGAGQTILQRPILVR